MTIDDIAEALGVSKTTVSRAISGKGRISAATTARVKEYIKEHNYTPNAVARSLVSKKTFNIGLVWPGDYEAFDLPFFQRCMKGISAITSAAGYDILLTLLDGGRIDSLKRLVENNKVDGLILTRTLINDEPADYLECAGIPFVAIGSSEDKKIIQIDNDNYTACKELTSVLIAKGMKKLALFGGNSNFYITMTRLKGFEAAYEDIGRKADGALVYLNCLDSSDVSVLIEDAIQKGADGIICMDDKIAAEVISKCRAFGIDIPRDIRLASFYNSTLLDNSIPPITSVAFDDSLLGQAAAKALIRKLGGKEVKNQLLRNYRIILQGSTA